MHNLEDITGLEYVDTSRVTDMDFMFYSRGYNSDGDWSMDLSSFNTKNVTSMESMFKRTGENNVNFTLNLGNNFDTSNVANIKSMFESSWFDNTIFILDLGGNFNISNVTDFHRMFIYICSTKYKQWNLTLKGSMLNIATTTDMFFEFALKINKTINVDTETTKK